MRVARLGNSSLRYDVGTFRGADAGAAAQGHFVHAYLDRESRRPSGLPEELRRALERIRAGGDRGTIPGVLSRTAPSRAGIPPVLDCAGFTRKGDT